jgi:glyoxylase-like metal-dependent hydrolase (beta-lactamase superfamily II)
MKHPRSNSGHKDAPTGFPNSNTAVVIGDNAVFVVDSCYQPSAAHEDIEQIRTWTTKPVRYLLNTHWHNDHDSGNSTYMAAFPGLQIIAQVETKKDMDIYLATAPVRMVRYQEKAKKRLATGKNDDGKELSPDEKKAVQEEIANRALLMEDYKNYSYQAPTLVFERELTLDLGNRVVEVKHLGRGNTSGDAIAYLPKENILIAGDLLVHPVPYLLDGYPTDWIEVLNKLAAMNAAIIVPGHGDIEHDNSYIYLLRDFLQSAIDQLYVRLHDIGPAEAHTLDEVKDSIKLSQFRDKFLQGSPNAGDDFDGAVTELIKLVFNEAALR